MQGVLDALAGSGVTEWRLSTCTVIYPPAHAAQVDLDAARACIREVLGSRNVVDFTNSTGLRYVLNGRRQFAKLFANGKVHVTGVMDEQATRGFLEEALARAGGAAGCIAGLPRLGQGAIQMANFVARLGYRVLLARLYEALAPTVPREWTVVYDPNIHASLKVRALGVTVLCFHTG